MKHTTSLTALLLLLTASACTQRDLSYAPPPQNRVFGQTVSHTVEFGSDLATLSPQEKNVLAGAFAGVDLRTAHKVVLTSTNAAQADAVREELIGLGVSPAAFTLNMSSDTTPMSPAKAYSQSVKADVTYYQIIAPNCNYWGVDAREANAWTTKSSAGCATNSNLGQMVVDPYDLLHGRQGSGPDAQAAASAVTRYRDAAASGASSGDSGSESASGSTEGQ